MSQSFRFVVLKASIYSDLPGNLIGVPRRYSVDGLSGSPFKCHSREEALREVARINRASVRRALAGREVLDWAIAWEVSPNAKCRTDARWSNSRESHELVLTSAFAMDCVQATAEELERIGQEVSQANLKTVA